jgi:aspartyl protease family protein
MMSGVSRPVLGLFACLAAALPAVARADTPPVPVSLPGTIERLARDGGFEVTGLDKAKDAYGRDQGGDTYLRLRALLEDFNHVIIQTPEGGVARVIIISRKTAWVPPPPSGAGSEDRTAEDPGGDIVVATERRGTSHAVGVGLEGAGGKRVEQTLTVDTGADFVVLPASLLGSLGIQPEGLESREVQTANGKTAARLGRLAAIWLGDHKVTDVQAAFIDDAKLGGSALLGMSVLSRYRMTIDDEANSLTLAPK